MKIGELQKIIEKIIAERYHDIGDLLSDAKKLAVELLKEANYNLEYIIQYFEGAVLELFILATLLHIDLEKLLLTSIKRILNQPTNFRILAE